MAVARCSECTAKLVYEDGTPKPAGTKTCCTAHKSKRARRLKAAAAKRGTDQRPEHVQEVSDAVKNGDALHEAAVDEFRPLIRESMTNDVLRSIDIMIQQTPLAIAALAADLENPDPVIKQRAYTLYLKYVLGNPSVAPPSQQAAPGGLTVQFNIPRPGDDPTAAISVESEAAELRTCEDCNTEQPEAGFVAGSNRCQSCFDGMGSMLAERFGDAYKP